MGTSYRHVLTLPEGLPLSKDIDQELIKNNFKTELLKVPVVQSVESIRLDFYETILNMYKSFTFSSVDVTYTLKYSVGEEVSRAAIITALSKALQPYFEIVVNDYLTNNFLTVIFKSVTEEPGDQPMRLVLNEDSWVKFTFKVRPSKDLLTKSTIVEEYMSFIRKLKDFAYKNYKWIITEYVMPQFTIDNIVINSLSKDVTYTMEFMIHFEKIQGSLTVISSHIGDVGLNIYAALSSSVFKPDEDGVMRLASNDEVTGKLKLSEKITTTTTAHITYTVVLRKNVTLEDVKEYFIKSYNEISKVVRKESQGTWATDFISVEVENERNEYSKGDEISVTIHLRFIKLDAAAKPLVISTDDKLAVQGIVVGIIYIALGIITYFILSEIIEIVKTVKVIFDKPGALSDFMSVSTMIILAVILYIIWQILKT